MDKYALRRTVRMRQSGRTVTPLTYGILRPMILLPETTDWSDGEQLAFVIAHEYVHIRRFDGLGKLLLTAAACVHWFNPLSWVMVVLANRDMEMSCDEAVVRSQGDDARSAYALALIGMEEKKRALSPIVNHFSKNAIEERIIAIMKIKHRSIWSAVLALAVVLGTVTAFATSAAAAEQYLQGLEAGQGNTVGYDRNGEPVVVTEEWIEQDTAAAEETLQKLRDGILISKSMGGDENLGTQIDPADWESGRARARAYELSVQLLDGTEAHFGPYDTAEELLAQAESFCREQAAAGNLSQEEAAEIIAHYTALTGHPVGEEKGA